MIIVERRLAYLMRADMLRGATVGTRESPIPNRTTLSSRYMVRFYVFVSTLHRSTAKKTQTTERPAIRNTRRLSKELQNLLS